MLVFGVGLLITSGLGCTRQYEKFKEYLAGSSSNNSTVVEESFQVLDSYRLKDIANLSEFDGLKEKVAIDSLWPAKGSQTEFVMPEDASPMLRLIMNGFTSKPELKEAYSYPVDKIKSRISVDMSTDAKTLYMVDSDNMVYVVDIDSKTEKQKFKSPIEGTYGILGDVAGQNVFLLNQSTLVKVELASGKVVGTITDVPGEWVDFDRALNVDILAGVTGDKKYIVIDEKFGSFQVLKEYTTESRKVAIHPKGEYIAGSANGQIFRWYYSGTPYRVEPLEAHELGLGLMPVTSDPIADRWFDGAGMHEYIGNKHTDSWGVRFRSLPFATSIQIADAASCYAGGYSWSTVVGFLADGSPKPNSVITNIYGKAGGVTYSSAMIPVDVEYINRVWASPTGDRVAIITDKTVVVYDRPSFDDPDGNRTAAWLATQVYDGNLEHIEACANYLRSQNWPAKMRTGESMYAQITSRLGTEWEWAEQNAKTPRGAAAIAMLDAWKATGSEMAVTASAIRHVNLGFEARGGGYASEVTTDGAKEFDRRIDLARNDLETLVSGNNPSGIALEHFVQCQMLGSDSIDDGFRTVKRSMELYPEFLGIHDAMTNWLLPRWGGAPGAINDYVTKIASLYPAPLQDSIYATLILDQVGIMREEDLSSHGEANADIDRVYRGAEALRSQKQLNRFQYETVARLGIRRGNLAKTNEYVAEDLRLFAVPTFDTHQTMLRDNFRQIKFEKVMATYRALQKAAQPPKP